MIVLGELASPGVLAVFVVLAGLGGGYPPTKMRVVVALAGIMGVGLGP